MTPAGSVTEYALPTNSWPRGLVAGPKGDMWFVEENTKKIGRITSTGAISEYPVGGQPHAIAFGGEGDLWIAEYGEIGKMTPEGAVTQYELPKMSGVNAITLGKEGDLWFTVGSSEGDFASKVGKITPEGVITEYPLARESYPNSIALGNEGDLWFTEGNAHQVGRITPEGAISEYALPETTYPNSITLGPEGNFWFSEEDTHQVGEITPTGAISQYAIPANSQPVGMTLGPENDLWFTLDEIRKIGSITTGPLRADPAATDTRITYYTAEANSAHPECGQRPEWALLPCRTEPVSQPNTEGVPNLPVHTVVYNMYDEPTETTETVGLSTRTSKISYDAAGRPISTETTSTPGKPLPPVSDVYSEATGALVEQIATEGAQTRSIKSSFNTLGQMTSYTDATGAKTSYEYEEGGEARLIGIDEAHGWQSFGYDGTSGELVRVQDSAAGVFEASYDAEGNMVSETYPNGMVACFADSAAGEQTGVTYYKSRSCGQGAEWYADSAVPTAHGQWASQQSSLGSESYGYDAAGRLIEVQETPTGKGCTTRLYGLDEESNRLSLTTRPPTTEGGCAGSGGSTETHSYDPANRLTDAGTGYQPFGEISLLPASDAGGTALESSFYVDGQLAEQTHGQQQASYTLDPAGRVLESTQSGPVSGTLVNHYAGAGEAPAWTEEPGSGAWTRYVEAFGGVAAVQESTGEVVLQLEDLQGSVVASAALGEAATELLASESQSEYGVASSKEPKRFGWLGKDLLPREATGTVSMGARSYVPQLGRFLQTDPQPEGSANAYAYTYGNPVNETDPSGEWTFETPTWLQEADAGWGQREAEAQIAREEAARREAERIAAEEAERAAQYAAAIAANSPTEGGIEEAMEWGGPEVIGITAQPSSGGSTPMARVSNVGPQPNECVNLPGGCPTAGTKHKKKCLVAEYKDQYGRCHQGPKVKRPKTRECHGWAIFNICVEPIVSDVRRS